MSRDRRPAADLPHRLVAVHLRHHDVDQRHVDVRVLLEDGDAVPARARHAAPRCRRSPARWSASRCCGCRRRRSAPWRRRGRRCRAVRSLAGRSSGSSPGSTADISSAELRRNFRRAARWRSAGLSADRLLQRIGAAAQRTAASRRRRRACAAISASVCAFSLAERPKPSTMASYAGELGRRRHWRPAARSR